MQKFSFSLPKTVLSILIRMKIFLKDFFKNFKNKNLIFLMIFSYRTKSEWFRWCGELLRSPVKCQSGPSISNYSFFPYVSTFIASPELIKTWYWHIKCQILMIFGKFLEMIFDRSLQSHIRTVSKVKSNTEMDTRWLIIFILKSSNLSKALFS